jgi:hypothetical protein
MRYFNDDSQTSNGVDYFDLCCGVRGMVLAKRNDPSRAGSRETLRE